MMKEVFYPDLFYRGIPNNTYIDNYLNPESFRLDDVRSDGYCEISITWNDEPESLDLIMSQTKEGTDEIQFKDGVAEISRIEIDEKMKPQIMLKNLLYERRPTPNNKYHGNLLVKNELNRQMKTMIKSQLALIAQGHILPNKYWMQNAN